VFCQGDPVFCQGMTSSVVPKKTPDYVGASAPAGSFNPNFQVAGHARVITGSESTIPLQKE
jgi:hypothetical protein